MGEVEWLRGFAMQHEGGLWGIPQHCDNLIPTSLELLPLSPSEIWVLYLRCQAGTYVFYCVLTQKFRLTLYVHQVSRVCLSSLLLG